MTRIIIKGLPTQGQHYFIFSIKFLIIFINSHLCHHRCHIINITRYQSTWWDFANLIVNPHLTHSLIPLQMALMSRCHLIQLQQTNTTNRWHDILFKKICFHQFKDLSKLSSKSIQIFIRCSKTLDDRHWAMRFSWIWIIFELYHNGMGWFPFFSCSF